MGDELKRSYGFYNNEGDVFGNVLQNGKVNPSCCGYETGMESYDAGGDDEPMVSPKEEDDDGEWIDVHLWMNKEGIGFSPYPYSGQNDLLKFDGLMRTMKIEKDGSKKILESNDPESIVFWNKIRERCGVLDDTITDGTVNMKLSTSFSTVKMNGGSFVMKHNPDGTIEYLSDSSNNVQIGVHENEPFFFKGDETGWHTNETKRNESTIGLIKEKERPTKIDYYLDMATVVAKRGTCLRRNYGSIIVKDDRIVSTGYTGAPRGRQNCCDIGHCVRAKNNIPRGERYELCRSVHSEMNAIINASPEEMKNATLYLVGIEYNDGTYVDKPNCCAMCKRAVINSGISHVIVRNKDLSYRIINVSDWIKNDDSLTLESGY